MTDIRILFKDGAFHALRSGPDVVADLERRGRRLAAVAGAADGCNYRVQSRQGASRPQGRWRVSVTTGDPKAIRSNAKHHTLLGALDAARE